MVSASSPRSSGGSAWALRTAAWADHQHAPHFVGHGRGLLGREDSRLDQPIRVLGPDRWLAGDPLVHQRLGVGRLIRLVVPVPAVADQVDDHVAVEFGPVGHRQADRVQAGFRIVGVDVDDRYVEALGQVGGPCRASRLADRGGEADLVVGDEVDGAPVGISRQAGQVEGLRHHALGGERRVPVDEDRDRPAGVDADQGAAVIRLLAAGAALHHRPHRLQVRGVRHEVDLHRAMPRLVRAPGAEVVLHVVDLTPLGTRPVPAPARLELGQDRLERQPDDMGENIQPAAVGHPDDRPPGALLGDQLEDEVEHGDHRVQPLDAEPLLAEVRLVQELLEPLHRGQPGEQALALLPLQA